MLSCWDRALNEQRREENDVQLLQHSSLCFGYIACDRDAEHLDSHMLEEMCVAQEQGYIICTSTGSMPLQRTTTGYASFDVAMGSEIGAKSYSYIARSD